MRGHDDAGGVNINGSSGGEDEALFQRLIFHGQGSGRFLQALVLGEKPSVFRFHGG